MPSLTSTPALPVRAVIAFGSNMPERIRWLQCGLDRFRETTGIDVLSFSRVYESPPVGEGLSGDFLNAAIACDTSLSPRALLETCLSIEAACGRARGVHMRVLEHVDDPINLTSHRQEDSVVKYQHDGMGLIARKIIRPNTAEDSRQAPERRESIERCREIAWPFASTRC